MTESKDLKGLGGWLILVGIGVVISPIVMLVQMSDFIQIFEGNTWAALTTPGSDFYQPYLGSLVIGEFIFNSLMFIAKIYLIYLFFSKHYMFPKVFIVLSIVTVVFFLIDTWLVTLILPDASVINSDTIQEFLRSFIPAVIWVPYMLVSKRVKATFVEKAPGHPMEPTAESVS